MKVLRFVVFTLIIVLLFRFVLVVRKVNCSVAQANLEVGVCEQLNQFFIGQSLFFTDFENASIWSELLASQQYTQAYQYQGLTKHLLGEIDLLLLAKMPDYRLIIGQERYLLNQTNKLKNDQANLSLLEIEFLGTDSLLEQGFLSATYHQRFLSLSMALDQYQLTPRKVVWLSNQEIHLLFPEIEVIIDDSKDFAYQMERLAAVLKQNATENIFLDKKILDMRFNLPVLKAS